MSCLKFRISVIIFLLAGQAFAQKVVEKFTPKECLMAKYETTVDHKGELWGLMKKSLSVKKDVCEITVMDKGFFDSSWRVDVCREPIHMKVTVRGNLDVYKRERPCDQRSQSEFCDFWGRLKASLEDQGLIFAEGEREKLSSSHGKVYCSYLLLNKYLGSGVLFSKYEEPVNIYKDNPLSKKAKESPSPAPPASKPQAPAKEEKVEAQGRF